MRMMERSTSRVTLGGRRRLIVAMGRAVRLFFPPSPLDQRADDSSAPCRRRLGARVVVPLSIPSLFRFVESFLPSSTPSILISSLPLAVPSLPSHLSRLQKPSRRRSSSSFSLSPLVSLFVLAVLRPQPFLCNSAFSLSLGASPLRAGKNGEQSGVGKRTRGRN